MEKLIANVGTASLKSMRKVFTEGVGDATKIARFNEAGKILPGCAKATTASEAGKVLPEFAKAVKTGAPYKSAVSSDPVRGALHKTNSLLSHTGAKINMEVPADTFLSQVPAKQRKTVASLLGNPDTVVCAAKANTKGSGFSILGLIGKKGGKTVGKGAVSVSQLGTPSAVAKWKFSGKNVQTNGFIDCAQTATPEQVSIIPSFVKKMFGIDVQAGNAARANVNINAKKAVDLLPEGKLGDMAHKQMSGVSQTNIDKLMNMARAFLC